MNACTRGMELEKLQRDEGTTSKINRTVEKSLHLRLCSRTLEHMRVYEIQDSL